MNKKIDLSSMAQKWSSPYVARSQLGTFTADIIKPKTMANLDSQGRGIPGMFKVGKKCVYPVSSVIAYLEDRVQQS